MERPPLAVIEGGPRAPGLRCALELLGAGFALTLVVTWMASLPDWYHHLGRFQGMYAAAFGIYALAVARVKRWALLPHVEWVVFGVALATRAALLPVPPSLSGDVYRYVWEGNVLAHGLDPYRLSPNAAALAFLRDPAVYPFVNHRELAAIYPPLALLGYAAVAALSPTVLALKLWCALHDLALVGVLIVWLKRRGGSGAHAIVYAWNPLVLVEFAGNGHNDPTGMVWLLLALMWAEERPVASALALAAGVLTKLAPLVALPFLISRWPWRARLAGGGLIAAGLGAYVALTRDTSSGLAAYLSTWRNNELAFHYLERWTGSYSAARTLAWSAVVAVLAHALARELGAARATPRGFRTALVLGPVLHPWYLGWTLMFEPLALSAPWLLLSFTAVLNYGVFHTPGEGRNFHLPVAWRWVEYGLPLLLGAALFAARRLRRRSRLRKVASAA